VADPTPARREALTVAQLEARLPEFESAIRGQGLRESTIESYVACTRFFLRWLAADGTPERWVAQRDRQRTRRVVNDLAHRVVVVDEAQWLNRECFEYLRYLHDDAATAFGLLLVGGAGCYEVLRREPMLDSRLYAHLRFAELTREEVAAVIPFCHPIYNAVPLRRIALIDDCCAHDNFRTWARFTLHAQRLIEANGREVLRAVWW
jgi:type II secretory pathway predicted ATPase ExeA